jgi:flagellar basal-body rod protein FlgB
MDIGEIPLFAMLRGRMGHLTERQRLIAQNVANADTAGYAPQDLKPYTFQGQLAAQRGVTLQAATQPGHMASASQRSGGGAVFKAVESKDSETTLDGNSVVLEEEMLKMTQARMNYDAAVSFYQKSLNLLRMASRAPGR